MNTYFQGWNYDIHQILEYNKKNHNHQDINFVHKNFSENLCSFLFTHNKSNHLDLGIPKNNIHFIHVMIRIL